MFSLPTSLMFEIVQRTLADQCCQQTNILQPSKSNPGNSIIIFITKLFQVPSFNTFIIMSLLSDASFLVFPSYLPSFLPLNLSVSAVWGFYLLTCCLQKVMTLTLLLPHLPIFTGSQCQFFPKKKKQKAKHQVKKR